MTGIRIDLGMTPAVEVTRFPETLTRVRSWLDLQMRTGRYAFGLAVDLAFHVVNHLHDVFPVYDEIGILEGNGRRSATKEAAPFKHPPLRGLWHKHYMQPQFLARNLRLELLRDDTVRKVVSPRIGDIVDDAFVGELVRAVTIENLERRAAEQRVTGEWLVYEKGPLGNYYLTVGTHGDDANIRARVDAYKSVDALIAQQMSVGAVCQSPGFQAKPGA